MLSMMRRMLWLYLLGGAGYGGWLFWQRRQAADLNPAPEWPPLDPPNPMTMASGAAAPAPPSRAPSDSAASMSEGLPVENAADATASATAATWAEPVDGQCPDGYPIKANDNSGIFHVPGGRFYERTVPERCYADAHDAEADGYRRAKA